MVPFQFVVAMLCGWLQREQEDVIAFLREENRVLKARLAGRRVRLDDCERRRLAELGHRWAVGCCRTWRAASGRSLPA